MVKKVLDETKRFILAIEELKKRGIVKNNVAIAVALDIAPSYITDCEAGRKNIGVENLRDFAEIYGISYDYIFRGELPMFRNEILETSKFFLKKEIDSKPFKITIEYMP